MRAGWWRWAGVGVALALAAVPARAGFQASDLLYVPAAAHNTGLEESVWRTDLYITNVDSVPIDVIMVYLPSGLKDNSAFFYDRSMWLGGRESDGVGFVNEALADIPPKGTVVLQDVVGEYWESQLGVNGLGAMVVFAQEAGSLQEDGSRVYANAVVNARIYNKTVTYQPDPDNEGAYIQVPVTYGQGMPGVPWYNLADPAAVTDDVDFSYQMLNGAVQNNSYRYNLGILNASDPDTTISVVIQALQPDGELYRDADGNLLRILVNMPPLSHVQYTQILSSLGIDAADQVTMRVSFVGWGSTSSDPKPAFTSYGSVVNAGSNDPATVLPTFAFPFNVDCMFPDTPTTTLDGKSMAAVGGGERRTERPLEVPPR